MLENIYKISNEKTTFLNKMHSSQFKNKLESQEATFQAQAIQIIQTQLTIKNMLILSRTFNSLSTKYKRTFLNNAKQVAKRNINASQNKCFKQKQKSNFALSLSIMMERLKWETKLLSFKKIFKQNSTPDITMKTKHKPQPTQLKLGFQQLRKQNNNIVPTITKNNLSFLDISIIQPKQSKEIGSICDLSKLQKHIYKDNTKQNKIIQLKQRVKKQMKQIQQYEQNQTKEVTLLRERLEQQKNKVIQDSCSANITQTHKKSELQTESASDVLLAKFIRKNFELQQKLQSVYQLLNAISPDLTTQFGRKLSKIMRKNTKNIDLQEI